MTNLLRPTLTPLEGREVPALFVALSADGLTLRGYDSDTPATVLSTVGVTGLDTGVSLVGIDYRFTNSKLYGVSSDSKLYTVDAANGAATLVGGPFSTALNGTVFGVDINPAADKLRIISNTNQNLRVSLDNGALLFTDPAQAYDKTQFNAAVADGTPPAPALVATAYTRNPALAGSTDPFSTTQYVIDGTLNLLSTQGRPELDDMNPAVSPNTGTLFAIDKLGFTANANVAFDIEPGTDLALVAVGNKLYSVNLATGGTVSTGSLPAAAAFRDIAVQPPAAGAGTFALTSATAAFPDSRAALVVNVTRTGGASVAATINYATANGTAVAGTDYLPASGTLSFAPGETTKQVVLFLPGGAAAASPAKTFTLTLSGPTGGAALAAPAVATVTVPAVTGDVFAGTVGLDADAFTFPASRGPLTVTVSRSGGLDQTARVDFRTVAGTAVAGTDFTAATGTLTFAPGVASQTITLSLPAGAGPSAIRTFTVELLNPSAGTALTSFQTATVAVPAAGTTGGLPLGNIVNGQPRVVQDRAKVIGAPQFSVGTNNGAAVIVNPDKSVQFTASGGLPGFTGAVRSVVADFSGDGVADVAVGTGPGAATRVAVVDGVTGKTLFEIAPFESTFTGGVYVAAGDVTGDGVPDLVITPDEGGGPRVRVFNVKTNAPIADYFGIDDANFRGGARPTVADVNGDGRPDVVVAAGFGGGPRVSAWSGLSVADNTARGTTGLLYNLFVFEDTLRNGTFVSAGDVTGDGLPDLVAGGGPGGGPRVSVFDGRTLLNNPANNPTTRAFDFFAGDPNNRDGVRVAVKDLDNDARGDLVTAAGTGRTVNSYFASKLVAGQSNQPLAFSYDAGGTGLSGVFVG